MNNEWTFTLPKQHVALFSTSSNGNPKHIYIFRLLQGTTLVDHFTMARPGDKGDWEAGDYPIQLTVQTYVEDAVSEKVKPAGITAEDISSDGIKEWTLTLDPGAGKGAVVDLTLLPIIPREKPQQKRAKPTSKPKKVAKKTVRKRVAT